MKMRSAALYLFAALAATSPRVYAFGEVQIGIQIGSYPELVPVPGYPVYYAPRLDSNYFFYDGLYWIFVEDTWYQSTWYNGPWYATDPDLVPSFILRIPVRYYRQPPAFFGGWQRGRPPRWGEHWGGDWERQRSGWDRWNRQSQPAPAPLPSYQNNFDGTRYPDTDEQRRLQGENYRYRPHTVPDRNGGQREPARRDPGRGSEAPGLTSPRGQGEPPAEQGNRQPAPLPSRSRDHPLAPVGQGEPPPGQGGRQDPAPSPRAPAVAPVQPQQRSQFGAPPQAQQPSQFGIVPPPPPRSQFGVPAQPPPPPRPAPLQATPPPPPPRPAPPQATPPPPPPRPAPPQATPPPPPPRPAPPQATPPPARDQSRRQDAPPRGPEGSPPGRAPPGQGEGRPQGRPEGRPEGERGNGGDRPENRGH